MRAHKVDRSWSQAKNGAAWAIGRWERGGFFVRRIVWGRLLARAEKRDDEVIVKAHISVDGV